MCAQCQVGAPTSKYEELQTTGHDETTLKRTYTNLARCRLGAGPIPLHSSQHGYTKKPNQCVWSCHVLAPKIRVCLRCQPINHFPMLHVCIIKNSVSCISKNFIKCTTWHPSARSAGLFEKLLCQERMYLGHFVRAVPFSLLLVEPGFLPPKRIGR